MFLSDEFNAKCWAHRNHQILSLDCCIIAAGAAGALITVFVAMYNYV
jgi:hypothetical protein